MGSGSVALRRAVKSTAAFVDLVRKPVLGIVVLVYHRVGGDSNLETDLPLDLFARQVEELASSGLVVPLSDALEHLRGGSIPRESGNPVVVTFDDGSRDFAENALPVLVRHGLPVTLYAATWFVDAGEQFAHGAAPLSWAALEDACATGLVEVGSHTHRHRLLDRISIADAIDEMDRSIELIGGKLGRPPLDLAYPKALGARGEIEREVRRRFRSAALAGTRPNPVGRTDLHRLARSPIQRSDGMRWFRKKVGGGLASEDSLRRAVNRVRYSRAET